MRRPARREPAHANKLPARPRPNLPAEIELNRPPASRSRGPASSLLKELKSGGHPSAADRPTNDAARTRSTPRAADGSLSEWTKSAGRRGCGDGRADGRRASRVGACGAPLEGCPQLRGSGKGLDSGLGLGDFYCTGVLSLHEGESCLAVGTCGSGLWNNNMTTALRMPFFKSI